MVVSPYSPEWKTLPLEERKKYWADLFGVDEDGDVICPPIILLYGFTDPSSFCRNPKCMNLVVNDRYCTRCGLKNKYYGK